MADPIFGADTPTCPYCGDATIEWFRQWGTEDSEFSLECTTCGKEYSVETNYSFNCWEKEEG